MQLVGLDLNMKIGWAKGKPGARPAHGLIRLTPCEGDYGLLAQEFDDKIHPILTGADFVGYESPIVMDNENLHTKMITAGLGVHLEWKCRKMGLPFMAFMPSAMKQRLCGNGRAKKSQMLARARELGFVCETDDVADGVAAWLCVLNEYDKEFGTSFAAEMVDPLFAGV